MSFEPLLDVRHPARHSHVCYLSCLGFFQRGMFKPPHAEAIHSAPKESPQCLQKHESPSFSQFPWGALQGPFSISILSSPHLKLPLL